MQPLQALATTSPEISEREKRHALLAREAQTEGIVLLKNDGVLPLKGGTPVALYGSGARKTIAGGTGSGAMNERYTVGIEEGLKNAGFPVTTQAWLDRCDRDYAERYAAWKGEIEQKTAGMYDPIAVLAVRDTVKFVYPTGIPVTEEDIAASQTDTAMYVIARQAGEGKDRSNEKGDFLLDDVEYENLRLLSEKYPKLIVVVNVGGLIDLSFMDEVRVDALVFFGQGGMEGGNAFADVVSGKVAPSGKLSCTWANKFEDYPSSAGYSHYGDPHEQNYREGIFVGYRYFDSFDVKPRYPFGYGLSYTTFSLSAGSLGQEGGKWKVGVTVTNTGKCTGKEVVQVYVSVPRRACNAEYQRLVAFAKTDALAPGKSQSLTLSFALSDLACYYPQTASYILNKGYYVVRVGTSSRDTHTVFAMHLGKELTVEQCVNVCVPREPISELTAGIPENASALGMPVFEMARGAIPCVKHTYAGTEPALSETVSALMASLSDEECVRLVVGAGIQSRNLVNVLGVSGNTTSELYDKYRIPNLTLSDGTAGLNVASQFVQTADGAFKPMTLYPQYDFGAFGQMMRTRLGKPEEGTVHYQYATAWPAEFMLAQSWNRELLERVGRAVAVEMEEFGVSVWLAPGANICRNPLCGRTFEYYSEDPFLAGSMAAATIRGVQEDGRHAVSLKHFACNNSEDCRDTSSSNLSERAFREIYLKGFRIAVETAASKTVMASYNKINGVYATNNTDLLVKVLRSEWGFEGLVMSDWNAADEGKGDVQKTMAAQCDLLMPGKPAWVEALKAGLESGSVSRSDLRRCAGRVLTLIEETAVIPLGKEEAAAPPSENR